MEAQYAQDPEAMFPAIAEAAGMDVDAVRSTAAEFGYPTMDEKLSDYWMAGGVTEYMATSAAKLEEAGQITALDDYAPLVDMSYLEAASKM